MTAHIDISIEFKNHQLDYQIPTEVTMGRLTELMHYALEGVRLPQKWRLELKDKNIAVDDTDLITDLPIGSGDVFLIVPLQEPEEHKNERI